MSLPVSFLDELRQRTTLSALLGRTMKLTRAGREHKGCCPFHDEKTPSFYVNDEKGFWHCFGCSAHGDAIRWMTEKRGLTFMDAVRELAAEAGMEVPAQDPRFSEKRHADAENHEIMQRAARWFNENLSGESVDSVREYASGRGITGGIAVTFELGYAPNSRKGEPSPLRKALHDVAEDRLVELGLLKRPDDASPPYDVFRDRLMFPIHDARGRCIGFGGRKLGKGEPKYLNTSATPLFDKGRSLFNLHRAAVASRKSGRLIIVEGYMDVIAMTRAGVAETVAPNGTALTEQQMMIAWRLADVPILCFDGDKAGKAAAAKAAVRALPGLEPGRSFSFIFPPEGQDPDDVLTKQGPAGLRLMLERPISLAHVLFQHCCESTPLQTPEQRAGLRAMLAEHCSQIADNRVKTEYQAEFRARLDALNPPAHRPGERRDWRKPAPPSAAVKALSKSGMQDQVGRAILCGLMMHPEAIARVYEPIAFLQLSTPALKALRDALVDASIDNAATDPARLDVELERHGLLGVATEIRNARHLPFRFLRPGNPKAIDELAATIGGMVSR